MAVIESSNTRCPDHYALVRICMAALLHTIVEGFTSCEFDLSCKRMPVKRTRASRWREKTWDHICEPSRIVSDSFHGICYRLALDPDLPSGAARRSGEDRRNASDTS